MSCPTIVQVTNISPQATTQQMTELFSYLGDINAIKLFPEDEEKITPSKVCFVDFKDATSVSTSLHLTNTIFIDRALVISRSRYDSIPGEEDALTLAAPAVAIAANQTKSVGHTAPLLPTPPSMTPLISTTNLPGLIGIVPTLTSTLPSLNMHLTPPTLPSQPLISMMGTVVPPAPPLTGNVDPTKIEEIRRTVYVGNLNSALTADQVLNFFLPCGEIKYVRMAGDETQPTRFVFVEFARPESVPIALQYNGAMFGDRPIKVNHSKNAIVKPQGPSAVETKREVDEAMKKVLEATMAITASITEETEIKKRSRTRSRTRSRDRKRNSRSRSRDRYRRRSRSRSPYYSRGGHRRNRGTWRDYSQFSRSPIRRRSRTPPRRRSRSPRRRSRSPPRRRSRTPPPRRRSRSPPPRRRSRTPPSRRRSRSPPHRRSRSPGRRRSRSPRYRPKDRSTSRSRSPSPPRRGERKRKRASSRTSHSPSPVRRTSRKKEHRRRSRSKSPFEEYGPVVPSSKDRGSSSNSRPKKRKHKHKHHKHRSPSRSLSPQGLSPSPRKSKRKRKRDSDEDDKSSVDSEGSPKSGISGVGGSPAVEGSGDDSEIETAVRRSSSESPSPVKEEKADSDSSYD